VKWTWECFYLTQRREGAKEDAKRKGKNLATPTRASHPLCAFLSVEDQHRSDALPFFFFLVSLAFFLCAFAALREIFKARLIKPRATIALPAAAFNAARTTGRFAP
jgi:hypothetical protein